MKPHIQSNFWSRFLIVLMVALMVAGGATAQVSHYLQGITKHVILDDDGYLVEIATFDNTVEDVLRRYDIALRPGDEIQPGLDEILENQTTIKITRAMSVYVDADGMHKTVRITHGTVQDALTKAGVYARTQDYVNYPITEEVIPEARISITRMDEEVFLETEAIPYQVITRKNNHMDEGVDKVVQEGKQGELQRKILVVYKDGMEISREVQEEKLAVEPVDRIVDKGTVKHVTNSRGDIIRYEKSVKMEITAYTAGFHCTGKNPGDPYYGITASGKQVKPYHTIAAAPGIPFGTKVYIPEAVEFWRKRGVTISGIFTVEDRGSAIQGNKLDIYMEDFSVTRIWGRRRNVTVYIMK